MSECQRLITPGTSAGVAGQTSHEDDLGIIDLQMRILHFVICRLILSVMETVPVVCSWVVLVSMLDKSRT